MAMPFRLSIAVVQVVMHKFFYRANMNTIVYNIANFIGLLLIMVGAIRHFGLDQGLLVGGICLILLNIVTLIIVMRAVD